MSGFLFGGPKSPYFELFFRELLLIKFNNLISHTTKLVFYFNEIDASRE